MYEPKGKTNAYIKSAFRKIWRWSQERREALCQARIARNVYKCKLCSKEFGNKEITVDHIQPVVEIKKGFKGWQVYYERMFVPVEGLQVICKSCHKIKSLAENKLRRAKCKNR